MIMKKIVSIVVLSIVCSISLCAQDKEGCKDHALLSRMPGFYIEECIDNYNQLSSFNAAGEETVLEGNLTNILYFFNAESKEKEPSVFQILKNYSNAILKIGGKKIFSGDYVACYELKKNGKEYNIKISDFANYDGGNRTTQFRLYVLEMEAMKQEITANEMLDALNKDGFIALNILFDTGKSTIQQESLPIIEQINELLKGDATLKVSIEGHTDNVGDAASNKKLSNDRAKVVMDALIAKGIDNARLSFIGWGQEKPVADNRTDEGKAKNRRVEIVKK
jgi:OOP family OmpA-OmpF porin